MMASEVRIIFLLEDSCSYDRHARQNLQWTLNGQILTRLRPSPSDPHSQSLCTHQTLLPKNVNIPVLIIHFLGPLTTESPPKPFNATSTNQFGNIMPVSDNNNGGSFLFSTTPTFNRNKFAPDFFTPRKKAENVLNSDVDVSSPGESSLVDDSPDPPRQLQSPYEKIRSGRKFQDAIRRKRIQKPQTAYISNPSKYDPDSDEDEGTRRENLFTFPASQNDNGKPTWTSDPDLPYVASGYVQLIFNMFLVGVALYIGFAFIRTIQRDVDQKVEEYSTG
jgi:hypothetical protein